ncbi:NUDIX hydrolase [Micromonospora sp. WMMD998]|uniref:NUDIX hydrolase n=1 Tax=Micromonospora sp. WMMD998 TaxID=3016092 RepID=UPI00249B0056|nr:NUDIX hydrolase [Micromonospora sp. WMMD998]WFE41134.1 NUDIX hydrolase [Micromonospora sp. WMMD998]
MEVREDQVERWDGTLGVYGVVDKPDCALIMPVDDGFHLVEQFRYPVGRRQWEFPQGSWASADTPAGFSGSAQDATLDNGAVALAQAELREETGLEATRWAMLGRVNVAHGYSNQGCVVFVASDLRRGHPAREATEQDMRQRWVTRAELDDMVRRGEFVDSLSLSALALYERSFRSVDGAR